MLTIREPIEMVSMRQPQKLSASFENRIAANYRLLDCRITAQELLYLASAGGEWYYAEGAVNNYYAVSQVMNRILLEEKEGFTYQDRVYITNILLKLGVRNAKNWVSQVRAFLNQYRNMNRLMNLYWDNHEVLKGILSAAGPSGEADGHFSMDRAVYERLGTKIIYEETAAFQKASLIRSQNFLREEFQTAAQLWVSKSLFLAELKEDTLGGRQETVPRYENPYEMQADDGGAGTKEEVLSQISSALLLNLISLAWQSRSERYEAGRQDWLDFAPAIGQTLNDTLERFEYYHNRGKRFERDGVAAQESFKRLEAEEIELISLYSGCAEEIKEAFFPALAEIARKANTEETTGTEMAAWLRSDPFGRMREERDAESESGLQLQMDMNRTDAVQPRIWEPADEELLRQMSVGEMARNKSAAFGETKRDGRTAAEEAERNERLALGETERNRQIADGEVERSRQTAAGEAERNEQIASGEAERNVQIASGEAERNEQAASGEAERNRRAVSGEAERNRRAVSGEAERNNQTAAGEARRNDQSALEETERNKQIAPGKDERNEQIISGETGRNKRIESGETEKNEQNISWESRRNEQIAAGETEGNKPFAFGETGRNKQTLSGGNERNRRYAAVEYKRDERIDLADDVLTDLIAAGENDKPEEKKTGDFGLNKKISMDGLVQNRQNSRAADQVAGWEKIVFTYADRWKELSERLEAELYRLYGQKPQNTAKDTAEKHTENSRGPAIFAPDNRNQRNTPGTSEDYRKYLAAGDFSTLSSQLFRIADMLRKVTHSSQVLTQNRAETYRQMTEPLEALAYRERELASPTVPGSTNYVNQKTLLNKPETGKMHSDIQKLTETNIQQLADINIQQIQADSDNPGYEFSPESMSKVEIELLSDKVPNSKSDLPYENSDKIGYQAQLKDFSEGRIPLPLTNSLDFKFRSAAENYLNVNIEFPSEALSEADSKESMERKSYGDVHFYPENKLRAAVPLHSVESPGPASPGPASPGPTSPCPASPCPASPGRVNPAPASPGLANSAASPDPDTPGVSTPAVSSNAVTAVNTRTANSPAHSPFIPSPSTTIPPTDNNQSQEPLPIDLQFLQINQTGAESQPASASAIPLSSSAPPMPSTDIETQVLRQLKAWELSEKKFMNKTADPDTLPTFVYSMKKPETELDGAFPHASEIRSVNTVRDTTNETVSDYRAIRKYLDQIDEKNKKNSHLMNYIRQEEDNSSVLDVPDMRQTRRDALTALTRPGEILQNINSLPRADSREAQKKRIETILRETDGVTRYICEQILAGSGEENTGQTSTVRAVTQEQMIAGLESVISKNPGGKRQAVNSSEELQPSIRNIQEAVPMIYRQFKSEMPDELLERISARQADEVRREVVTQIEKKVTMENTKDSTLAEAAARKTAKEVKALIEDGILKQIGPLSDKVYQRLEKRLRSEQARRGRI